MISMTREKRLAVEYAIVCFLPSIFVAGILELLKDSPGWGPFAIMGGGLIFSVLVFIVCWREASRTN